MQLEGHPLLAPPSCSSLVTEIFFFNTVATGFGHSKWNTNLYFGSSFSRILVGLEVSSILTMTMINVLNRKFQCQASSADSTWTKHSAIWSGFLSMPLDLVMASLCEATSRSPCRVFLVVEEYDSCTSSPSFGLKVFAKLASVGSMNWTISQIFGRAPGCRGNRQKIRCDTVATDQCQEDMSKEIITYFLYN